MVPITHPNLNRHQHLSDILVDLNTTVVSTSDHGFLHKQCNGRHFSSRTPTPAEHRWLGIPHYRLAVADGGQRRTLVVACSPARHRLTRACSVQMTDHLPETKKIQRRGAEKGSKNGSAILAVSSESTSRIWCPKKTLCGSHTDGIR